MKITDHKLSEGIALTFRVPEGNIKHPLIILCHGFCGIRNVLLPCFANAFTEAGFATITFDYRGFGESDGERGRLVPAMQTEDIISVINWAEKQECIDNQRIGLWGTSLGGGHVFSAAAQDQRVKCIVSQLAFADGDVLVTGEMTVLTVGLVSCAGKSLPRFWPGDFFPVFYACHLAVLGVLAL